MLAGVEIAWIVDFAIVFILVEVLIFAVFGRRQGPIPALLPLVPTLAAGAALLLALRAALAGLPDGAVLICLAVAFIAHSIDMLKRRAR